MCDDYLKYLTLQNHFKTDSNKEIIASDNSEDDCQIITGKSDLEKTFLIEDFNVAVKRFDRPVILRLLSQQPNLLNIKNEKGQTGLITAIQLATKTTNQSLERMIAFLLAKKSDIHLTDNEGKSALHHAILNEQKQILQLILKYVSVDKDFVKNHTNPLHYAVGHNKLDAVKMILANFENIDLSLMDESGDSVFHTAIMQNNVKILTVLLEKANEEQVTVHNKKGLTPILLAVLNNSAECVEIFLNTKFGKMLRMSKLASTGEGLIQFSERHQNHQLTLKLLDYPDIPIDTTADKYLGVTVMHWAVFRLNKKLIKELLKRKPVLVNTPDSQDWSPLAHLVQMYSIKKEKEDQILEIGAEMLLKGAQIFSVKHKDVANVFIQKILIKALSHNRQE